MAKQFCLPAMIGGSVHSVVLGVLVFSTLVVGAPVFSVVGSLVVSLLGVVSFGSVLLDSIVVKVVVVIVVDVALFVVVSITQLLGPLKSF